MKLNSFYILHINNRNTYKLHRIILNQFFLFNEKNYNNFKIYILNIIYINNKKILFN